MWCSSNKKVKVLNFINSKFHRWECDVCDDFDVCNNCYLNKITQKKTKHNRQHTFSKFDIITDSSTPPGWTPCPLTVKRNNEAKTLVVAFDEIAKLNKIETPNAARWSVATLNKILQAYEEALHEYSQQTDQPPEKISSSVKKAYIMTAIAFTGSTFQPSFNKNFENAEQLEPSKKIFTALLSGFTKICIFFENFKIPYGTGTLVYEAWSAEKGFQKLLEELKSGKMYDKIKAETVKEDNGAKPNRILRTFFTSFFEEIQQLWLAMTSITPQTTIVTKTGKLYFGASIKGSCYLAFLFKTLVYRIRSHGMGYLWDLNLLKKKGLTPTRFEDVFKDFSGPFDQDKVDKAKEKDAVDPPKAKVAETTETTVTLEVTKPPEEVKQQKRGRKRKKQSTDNAPGKKDAAEDFNNQARLKTLEAKVSIITHSLTIALEKIERLQSFVEILAGKVTS